MEIDQAYYNFQIEISKGNQLLLDITQLALVVVPINSPDFWLYLFLGPKIILIDEGPIVGLLNQNYLQLQEFSAFCELLL